MRQRMNHLLMILCMAVCVVTLAACGSRTPEAEPVPERIELGMKSGAENYLKQFDRYDDAALEKYRKTHKNFTLQRYKGLGEMDASQLWETTLNPETRVLKQVEIDDARMANEVTQMLMGSEVGPRRSFIVEHADEAELDV